MIYAIALKLFSDCCIMFAILGAFPSVFSCSRPLLFMAAIAAVSAGLAFFCREKGKLWLSRICAVLPFSGLLLAGAPLELSVLLPAAVYTSAVILRGNMQLEYYSYRQFFLHSLYMLGAFIVVLSAFTVMEAMTGPEEFVMHPEIALRYSLVHLLCGVVLQRQLRLGAFGKGHGDAGQIVAMLGGTGIVLFGFVLAEPMLRKGGAAIFRLALSAVLSVAMTVLELFSSVLDQIELGIMARQIAKRRQDTLPSYNLGIIADEIQQTMENPSEEPSLWWVIPVVIVLLAAMVFMFLSFRKKVVRSDSPETLGTAPAMKQQRKDPRRSYRWRIRQLYRDFLRMEKKRGLGLRSDQTSLDVLESISPDTDARGAESLRQIYIAARYDLSREPGRDDYEAAKAALKKCREQA